MMQISYGPRGILQIDDARIVFRNFTGVKDRFNAEGDRNFAVVIEDEEVANDLIKDGWNVKIKAPRDEDDAPFMYLPVKIKFTDRSPIAYLKSGSSDPVRLDEETISCLDEIDIAQVDLDIRPYDWVIQEGTPHEKSGRTAYLQSIHVIQALDRFAARYENIK